ncbi:MBL fold metallo-hydrolase [Paucibacter sp. DJ1R-11]|uniref:MBL fold metallo-hydrolase n=1 Tax=Paucibacter sp. DJ1R-11 TaxID=2893556 RepID=UPI0021E4931C|nr:MBL fold metallo-hydrolase [Paucibacter sp. DJ1R-11]MCV2362894.1 MBL fold metallo-hydrolase [Paucibacter sp. DJ1R-11]
MNPMHASLPKRFRPCGLALLVAFCALGSLPSGLSAQELRADEAHVRAPGVGAALQLDMRTERLVGEQARNPAEALARVPLRQQLLLDPQGRYRLETDSVYPGPVRFQFLEIGRPEGVSTVDLLQWRQGLAISRLPAAAARERWAEQEFLVPAWLLQRLSAARGEPASDGSLAFEDGAGRPARLALDGASDRVLWARSAGRRYEYSDYETLTGGLQQPRRISEQRGEAPAWVWQVRAVATPNANPAAFTLPAGYTDAPTDSAGLRATPLGAGSYRVDGSSSGYHSSFSIGSQGIVVYDAPVSPAEAALVRALIEQLAPGRKVSHVVVSHAHRDHIAGLPAYQADAPRVLVGPQARQALRRQLGAAWGVWDERVQELQGPQVLDLGDRRVQLWPLASSHASDMLVAYDGQSRALFQGDLFYIPDFGPVPPAFATGQELLDLIQAQRLEPAWIVGVHGRSGTVAELRQALALRAQGLKQGSAFGER